MREIPLLHDADISLRHLRALSLLLDVQNLTKAAELLGTNQPTVSKMLARLRLHFSDPLFVRVGHQMQPTPRAIELAESLRGLLAVADSMRAGPASFDPLATHREFRVLLSEIGMVHFVPLLMQALEKAGGGLRLRAMPLDSRSVTTKLESGEVDVAIGDFPREIGNIKRQKLYSEHYVSIVRRDHPRASRLTRLDEWLAERHILVTASSAGHGAHEHLERALLANLAPERIQLRVPSFIAAAHVVSRTDAVGTLPSKLAVYLSQDFPLVQVKPPPSLPKIEIAQIWHERMHRDQGNRWLRSVILAVAKKSETARR